MKLKLILLVGLVAFAGSAKAQDPWPQERPDERDRVLSTRTAAGHSLLNLHLLRCTASSSLARELSTLSSTAFFWEATGLSRHRARASHN